MKYFAYLGTFFCPAQTEPSKILIQQICQLSVEAQPQRANDDTFFVFWAVSGLPNFFGKESSISERWSLSESENCSAWYKLLSTDNVNCDNSGIYINSWAGLLF